MNYPTLEDDIELTLKTQTEEITILQDEVQRLKAQLVLKDDLIEQLKKERKIRVVT